MERRCKLVLECITQAPTRHKPELDRLLRLNFQPFTGVPILAEHNLVSRFLAPPKRKHVSSLATGVTAALVFDESHRTNYL
jgi:hypothetical protein